jgi:hypothetical protein
MEQDEPTQVAQPMETTGMRRSMRVKIQLWSTPMP